jgi:hypothetical protein
MRSYVLWFCGVSGAAIASVAALNYIVDPYLTHQWDTPAVQRLRPPRERLSVWSKTYAVARYRPDVIYLGNSRTEVGMPAPMPEFQGKTVFNGALSGASAGDVMAMARHVLKVSAPEIVVWGLDAPSFSLVVGTHDFDRDLVATGSNYFSQRALLNIKRSLTVDMTRDSVLLLAGRFGAVCRSSLALYGQHDEQCLANRIGGWGGTSTAVAPRVSEYVRGAGPSGDAMSEFTGVLASMCQRGIKVRLYINPTHATTADALFWSGKWSGMEQWLRTMTERVSRERGKGCDAKLYDFSGFNSVTTEPIPQASHSKEMAYYWEPSHYRANVGRMIIRRMFGGMQGSAAGDFGIELLPTMLDQHLAAGRAARDDYHQTHPIETRLSRELALAQRRDAAPAAKP